MARRPARCRLSDERLRELERRCRASGAVEDEVLLLRERVRAGDLTGEGLALAAHCGHEAALRALDRGPQPVRESVRVWAARFVTLGGRDAVVAALVAVARGVEDGLDSIALTPDDVAWRLHVTATLVAVEAWLAEPARWTRGRALRAQARAQRAAERRPHPLVRLFAHTVDRAAQAVATGLPEEELLIFLSSGVAVVEHCETQGLVPVGTAAGCLRGDFAAWVLRLPGPRGRGADPAVT